DGYYYFVGRRDDMINVAGENVYPKEVEDILLQHPNLRDACVVPAPHDVKGEVPVAFVVARESGRTTEDDVRRFFLERGAPYAHPRRVVFLDALPLGGTGKIDRSALKAAPHGAGAVPPPGARSYPSIPPHSCASSASRSCGPRRAWWRSGCRSARSSSATTAPTGCTAAWSPRWPTSRATTRWSRRRARACRRSTCGLTTCDRPDAATCWPPGARCGGGGRGTGAASE